MAANIRTTPLISRIHDHARQRDKHPRSRMGSEVFHTLKTELSAAGLSTGIGDERIAPNLSSTRDALDFVLKSIEKAGYAPGEDIYLAWCASTEYYKDGKYVLAGENKTLSSDENVAYLEALVNDYPIISIEDGMAEDDWASWQSLTDAIGDAVGRRRSVCDKPRAPVPRITDGCANSMLVKVSKSGPCLKLCALWKWRIAPVTQT